jgi:CRP-like cAMP-binding protein
MTSIEDLKLSSFFQDFKKDHLSKIEKLCHEEVYQAQDVIIKEGEGAKKLYILIEGVVAIQIQLKKYQDAIVSTIEKKGELFGWSALVEPKCYTAAVKCLEKVKVLSICGEELEKLFEDDPVMGLAFMKKIASLIDNRLITMRKRLISSIS